MSHSDLVRMVEVLESGGAMATGGKVDQELVQRVKRGVIGWCGGLSDNGILGGMGSMGGSDAGVVDLHP